MFKKLKSIFYTQPQFEDHPLEFHISTSVKKICQYIDSTEFPLDGGSSVFSKIVPYKKRRNETKFIIGKKILLFGTTLEHRILSKKEWGAFPLIEGEIITQKEGVLIRCILKERKLNRPILSILLVLIILPIVIYFCILAELDSTVWSMLILVATLLVAAIIIDEKRKSVRPKTKNFVPLAKGYLTNYFENAKDLLQEKKV